MYILRVEALVVLYGLDWRGTFRALLSHVFFFDNRETSFSRLSLGPVYL